MCLYQSIAAQRKVDWNEVDFRQVIYSNATKAYRKVCWSEITGLLHSSSYVIQVLCNVAGNIDIK